MLFGNEKCGPYVPMVDGWMDGSMDVRLLLLLQNTWCGNFHPVVGWPSRVCERCRFGESAADTQLSRVRERERERGDIQCSKANDVQRNSPLQTTIVLEAVGFAVTVQCTRIE
jgi:hypothetical protein